MALEIITDRAINSRPCVEDGALTPTQYVAVLETIAGRSDTLHRLLMLVQQGEELGHEASVLIDAAESLCASIGAMADSASGAGVIGDHDRWNYGPNFAAR